MSDRIFKRQRICILIGEWTESDEFLEQYKAEQPRKVFILDHAIPRPLANTTC